MSVLAKKFRKAFGYIALTFYNKVIKLKNKGYLHQEVQ